MKTNDLKINLTSLNKGWQFIILVFTMSVISVFASLLMDQKLYKKQKNKNELEILKASFSIKRRDLIDLKRSIMIHADKFNLKRNPNIIVVSYE